MNISSRRLLSGALFLLFLLGACNTPAGTTPTTIGTILPTGQITDTPLPTNTSVGTATAFIPITGMDVVSLQCQFCVNEEAHAVLIVSNQVSFDVADPAGGITCATAQEVNGRRILLCRGPQQTTFTLNICVEGTNCLQFPVTLQPCPLIPETGAGTGTPVITFTPITPVFLTPINTLIPPTRPRSTSTSVPRTQVPTQTAQPPATATGVPPTIAVTPTSPPSTSPPATPTDIITLPTLPSITDVIPTLPEEATSTPEQ